MRLLAGVAVAVIAVTAGFFPAALAASGSSGPSYGGDFPDPAVVNVGGTYWAYSTGSGGRNLNVMSSPDLQHWSAMRDPLPSLPAWAAPGLTWSPGVIERDHVFVMFYAAQDAAAGRECISEAVSTSPAGPFIDHSSGPLICQLSDGGSIDPTPYLAPSGSLYLLWKSDDNAIGQPTHLWAQALSGDARTLVGSRSEILSETEAWQTPSLEGPAMVANGGLYYLLYSANRWALASSGIGYAVCASVLGPCVNSSTSGPWLGSRPAVRGPQGPWVFTATDGSTKLAYAAWNGPVGYAAGGVRSLWIGTLSFGLGGPVLH